MATMSERKYAPKICTVCKTTFVPRSAASKLCPACKSALPTTDPSGPSCLAVPPVPQQGPAPDSQRFAPIEAMVMPPKPQRKLGESVIDAGVIQLTNGYELPIHIRITVTVDK